MLPASCSIVESAGRRHPAEDRDPVFASINNLSVSVGVWRHTLDQRDLFQDGRGVGEDQNAIPACSVADAISGAASSLDPNKVIPQILKLFLDAAAAGIANRHNTNERASPHRDAKDPKDTFHPVTL